MASLSLFRTKQFIMKGRDFKDAMYSGLSKLMKALANPARLEIIEMLSQGEKSVEGVVEATNLTFANASQHLQVLKNNNIVKSRKELEKTLNRQREDNHALNSVTLDELEQMIHNKNVLLMDVRPSAEYELDHITGAVSVPMNDLLCCLKDFSKDQEIIAYCRGPFCVLADEAVKVLSENGFKVRRLDDGYPEWKIRQLEKQM